MKATAPVLSAHSADSAPIVTANYLSQSPSYKVLSPRENGDAAATKQKTPFTKKMPPSSPAVKQRPFPPQHLNGRTNLKPSQLLHKPITSFKPPMQQQQQQIPRFSPPLQESVIMQESLLLQQKKNEEDQKPLFDWNTMAPIVASSHVMMDLENAIVSATTTTSDNDNHDVSRMELLFAQEAAFRTLSSLVLTDLVSASVRYGLPHKFVARQWRRNRRRRQAETTVLQPPPPAKRQRLVMDYTLRDVRGIHNFGGQSCFLNSVLQALASLPSFLAYLERIVSLQHEQSELNEALLGSSSSSSGCHRLSFSECLLVNLSYLNGSSAKKCDAREVLYRVGKSHAQFRSRHGRAHVGTEQQDAQEVLQALMGMVIADACLDLKQSENGNVVKTPLDFSSSSQLTESSSSNSGEDSVLSLSSFLTRIDLEQKEEEKRNGEKENINGNATAITDGYATKSNGHGMAVEENGHLPREEKKQEDYELEPAVQKVSSPKMPYNTAMTASNGDNSSVQSQLSTSTLHMLQTLSPMTPSPLSGWIGSTLQCCTCHHVRPIQNAPFLDIPIVPTSVSRYLSNGSRPMLSSSSPCTLHQCLKDFSSVERVHDVECRSCTLQREVARLEEEIFMLRGAVETILTRCRKRGCSSSGGENQVKVMRNELQAAQVRHARLLHSDPDDECDNDDLLEEETTTMQDEFNLSNSKTNKLMRGDAKKCLLLTRMPNVLCLHVQRRYYDPVRNCMAKALQHIDFPQILDLATHCAYGNNNNSNGLTGRSTSADQSSSSSTHEPILYKLQSIIEHRGNAHAGHYQTYRRAPPSNKYSNNSNANDDKWVLVSDLTVTPLSWKDVKRCQAYMLFYEAI